MNIAKKLKEHAFLILVVFAYIAMFIFRADMGIASLQNSAYYLREMLTVMPVIFLLTALLDAWLPKEKVIRYLGRESGAKGILFAFALGSVSAGPLYAAFPMCVMLHKKGASIRNIVIILSSWAVIKIPMLVNEAKFLGLQFMAARYVLTVIAILLFSWITAKFVKDEDLPEAAPAQTGLQLNRDACMGCALCAKNYPELFRMEGKKAVIQQGIVPNASLLEGAMRACPASAITNHGE